jgi:nucleoid-associated protein YgaU
VDRGAAASPVRWPLAAWLATLAGGIALFHLLGTGPLAAPPLTEPAAWGAWASEREPAVATVAILRLVVLALAWYLVGVTTIGLVARLARAARLVRVADALTVPALRRFLQGALGLGLATAMVGAAAPGAHRPSLPTPTVAAEAEAGSPMADPADGVQLVRAADDEVRLARVAEDEVRLAAVAGDEVRLGRVTERSGAGGDPVVAGEATDGPLPLELLDRAGSDERVTLRRIVVGDRADREGEELPGPSAPAHEVVAGDSLWTIARDALATATSSEPDEPTVHRYWRELIELNRHRLVDPGNPDLIFPGQRFELPPVIGAEEGRARSGP